MHRLLANIHQQLDRRPDAIKEYSRYLGLWDACDPALQPEVDGAKAELASLIAEPR
ncbi:MAG: hypothetical protein H0T58_07790 [Gemmatimonadales bacterium]|nr:hypothetical protein [Gemmatimonadales bacterium]